MKVKQVEGNAGLGWNILVGGEISRQVRGLPDDIKTDNSSNTRLGWLHSGVSANINPGGFLNDNNQGTTYDEETDIYMLTNSFPDHLDTEPDIFYVNAPGINCKLVIDGNGIVQTIPYKDIKVTYQTVTDAYRFGQIKSFQITTENGITYHFDKQEWVTKLASNTGAGAGIKFFKKEYQRYMYGINYVGSWKLSKVSDQSGYFIELDYTIPHGVVSKDRMEYAIGNTTTMSPNFTNTITTNQIRPTKIFFGQDNGTAVIDPDILYPPFYGRSIDLSYTNAPTSGQYIINGIYGLNKTVELNYVSKYYPLVTSSTRTLLKSVAINGKRSNFEYYGESQYEMDLPDSLSKKIDIWGYYNNSSATSLLPRVYINPSAAGYERYRNMSPGISSSVYPYGIIGEDREVNASVIANGSLKKISYDDGGSSTIVYEPNTYKDLTAGAVVQGGGIRVQSLTSYDGVDALKNRVRTFTYTDPLTGVSSGKALLVPLLSFTTPYAVSGTTEQQWQNSVVRLEENFSQENAAIVYTHVTESVAGAGSSLYQYKAPGTFWDGVTVDWAPTLVNVARPTPTFGGYASNELNAYPFPPNQNYDFERGMIEKISQFNENGDKVTESNYTYQRTDAPVIINALVSDFNNAVVSYATYPIYTKVGNLTQQETVTKFDAPSTSQFRQSVTSYSYNGNNHKHPTMVMQTNSDGSIVRNYSKFVKDYDASTHADEQSTAIYNLQQLGLNFPVETTRQVESNGLNKTYSASLVKLKPWTLTYGVQNLPVQSLVFSDPVGVADFSSSSISGGNFLSDNRYFATQNITNYSSFGVPLSTVGRHKVPQTAITGLVNNRSIASFSNASVSEIAFNNFENDDFDYSFAPGYGGTYNINHRSGYYAFDFGTANYLSRVITKNNNRKEYILSLWVNSAVAANISLLLTNSSNATSTYLLPISSTDSNYKYHELKVPVSSMSDIFTAKIQTDQQLKIDDALFYPADAIASTTAYDGKLNQTALTNTNGISQYFDYDLWNRLVNVRDNERNIVKKMTYVTAGDKRFNNVTVSNVSGTVNQSIQFWAGLEEDSYGSITYTWDFGDGSAPLVVTNPSVNHTYTAVGNYTVTVTKSSSVYGNSVASATATVTPDNTPAVIGGAGDITLAFFQGTTFVGSYSGSQLWLATVSMAPGVYRVVVSTPNRSYGSSNPSGHKKAVYYTTTSTGTSTNCSQSPLNSYSTDLYVNVIAGSTMSFSVEFTDCFLEEL